MENENNEIGESPQSQQARDKSRDDYALRERTDKIAFLAAIILSGPRSLSNSIAVDTAADVLRLAREKALLLAKA